MRKIEQGTLRAEKTIQKKKLKNAFDKYRGKKNMVKREAHINGKVEWFNHLRNYQNNDKIFYAWKAYVQRYKKAKKYLAKGIRNVSHSICDDAFDKWKKLVHSQKTMVFMSNIEELENRQVEHDE